MAKKASSNGAAKQPIKWIKGALIGAGSFGSVYLGMNAKNGLLMAVKQVELPSGQSQNDQKKKRMLDALEGEIELLKTIQHENIVQYLDSYADGTHLNIFLEYVPGGSVVALLRNYGAFEEPLVRNFVRQILHGLSFLHGQDIVHRDIKGANILVDNKSCIKISDFGISKKVESDLLTNARAHRPSLQGSVFWMAPEVVKQTSYSRKADIWSLGCLVVEMMSGTHPWPNLNQMQALFKIGSCAKPSLPEEISEEAIDFLEKTFEIDHEKRPTADELLRHAFITEEVPGAAAGEDVDSEAGTGEVALQEGEVQGSGARDASTAFPVAAPSLATTEVEGATGVPKRRERQASHANEG
jgi:mitogen-activated protein kinase kinase kinase